MFISEDYFKLHIRMNTRERIENSKIRKPALIFFALLGGAGIGLGIRYEMSALLWSGVGVLSTDLILAYMTRKKSASFSFATHNVGRNGDCYRKQWFQGINNQDLVKKRRELLSEPGAADIVCMQESFSTFDPISCWQTFPEHIFIQAPGDAYSIGTSTCDTAIGWNVRKFQMLGDGYLPFVSPFGGQLNTKVVLLRHLESNRRILVASAHIEGFSILDKRMLDQSSQSQLTGFGVSTEQAKRIKGSLSVGDGQLSEISLFLEQLAQDHHADTVIIGMDANSDMEIHEARFQCLKDSGYIFDGSRTPTFLDVSTNYPVKLDHVALKPKKSTGSLEVLNTPVEASYHSPNSYCDHSMVITRVSLTG